MEIIPNGGGGMRNRLINLMEKDGFYIILFICVCIVAVTATMVTRDNVQKTKEDKLSKVEDFIIVDEENSEPSLEIARMEELIPEEHLREEYVREVGEAEEVGEVDDTVEEENPEDEDMEEDLDFVADEEPEPLKDKVEMILPVEGKLGATFTTDSLVYSDTLEEWTSHKGIDLFADEGTQVNAALSGTIMEVYEDELWGIVIIMDHGEGLMTKYANLSTKDMVREGQRVNQGQPISKVGRTAAIEMMMEPHIHFEVIQDGINIDPTKILPAFSHLH